MMAEASWLGRRRLGYGLVLALGFGPLGGCEPAEDYQCPAGMVKSGPGCAVAPAPPSSVALNSVGYFPNRIKRATVLAAGETFSVIRADGTEARAAAPLQGPALDEVGRSVWIADFSDLRAPGTYRIRVPGVEDSPEFTIGDDAYRPVVESLMSGFYGWRCGVEITIDIGGRKIHHGLCHAKPAVMDAVNFGTPTDSSRDLTGGWHDAGDYGKYVVNGAFSVSIMLKAFEYFPNNIKERVFPIPETGGKLPDYLDEIRWELDWMLKMQFEDGGVANEVQTAAWPSMIAPEADTAVQHVTSAGTVSTAYFAAVMAEASRVFAPYDPALGSGYLAASQLAAAYLAAHPDRIRVKASNLANDAYSGANEPEARMWAAAELWETTGNPANLADFESRAQAIRNPAPNWDWARSANLAIFTYLLSQRPEKDGKDTRNTDLIGAIRSGTLSVADAILNSAVTDVYGNSLPKTYYWGINGVTARTSLNLAVAYRLSRDPKYLDGVVIQVDHLMGRNYFARSQVTGIGHEPPRHPHHRPSYGASEPYPGLLVGGPNKEDNEDVKVSDWVDSSSDYYSNEVAINWNASLLFGAIAASEPAEPVTGGYGGAGTAGAGGAGGVGGAGGISETGGSGGEAAAGGAAGVLP